MSDGPHPVVGEQAPSVVLLNHLSEPVDLATLWQSQPIALFFVRHLGCPFCREHVSDVRDDYPRMREAGGAAVVVTMGSPSEIARFHGKLKLPFLCLSDQSQKAYRAYSVPRGSMFQIASPRVWLAGLQAIWRGGIGVPKGDVYQLHAAFVVDQQGVTRFVHRPKDTTEQPDREDILTTIQQASGK